MKHNERLQLLAANTVHTVLQEGAKQPRDHDWPEDSPEFHALKCIRHMTTFLLIRQGLASPDHEDHGKLAATRAMMAVYTS